MVNRRESDGQDESVFEAQPAASGMSDSDIKRVSLPPEVDKELAEISVDVSVTDAKGEKVPDAVASRNAVTIYERLRNAYHKLMTSGNKGGNAENAA